jgi:cyclopropane-fatty-acyl-phospholipid synthase
MSLLSTMARRGVASRLSQIQYGRVTVADGGTPQVFGNGTGPAATITVHDPRFYRAVALGGHLGAAEAYLDGWWTSDNLVALVQVLVRNRETLDGLERGLARLARPARALAHFLRRNTRTGSRRNISAHYDLGNEFFRQFLDDTLAYSCGIFASPESTLREASVAKFDRICKKLDLGPADHLLEIGTGWGGFAIHAAGEYGCRVTTTTISREQLELATSRVATAGLAGQVTVVGQDYRDLTGTFDKLVSIEMIEAVGHQYLPGFFRVCADRLVPGGRFALQAITIEDRYYEAARREVDFIKRYVFPGSCIPSREVLEGTAARAHLTLVDLEDLTPHYAETLKRWRQNLVAHRDAVRALGFSEEFLRLWEFYFSYCEGGFRERVLGDLQMVFVKGSV